MNAHLFNKSFKVNSKGLLVWTIAACLTTALMVFLYPVYKDIFSAENMPEELANLFPQLDFDLITNYFAFEAGTLLIIIGSIYAALLGMNILKREFQDNSGQILYTMPISRTSIVTTKFINLIVNIVIFNAAATIIGFASMAIVEGGVTFNVFYYLQYMFILMFITMIIGLISFALTTHFKSKTSTGLNIGLVLVFFIISTVAGVADSVSFLEYLSPMSYLFLEPTVMEEGIALYDIWPTIAWGVSACILVSISIFKFKNTDIL